MNNYFHCRTQNGNNYVENGWAEDCVTSTVSRLCIPNTEPMRWDRGWLPKSLLTYLEIKRINRVFQGATSQKSDQYVAKAYLIPNPKSWSYVISFDRGTSGMGKCWQPKTWCHQRVMFCIFFTKKKSYIWHYKNVAIGLPSTHLYKEDYRGQASTDKKPNLISSARVGSIGNAIAWNGCTLGRRDIWNNGWIWVPSKEPFKGEINKQNN